MYDVNTIIRQRAREKRARALDRLGDRDRFVLFDEWLQVEHPEVYGRWGDLTKPQRNKLYCEYQSRMIEMGFCEWQRAKTIPGVSTWYDLIG